MKRLYTLVSVLLCVVMLLSACTTGNVETSSNADASQAADPSNGSSTRTDINIALSHIGNSMDPHNSGVTIDLQVRNRFLRAWSMLMKNLKLLPVWLRVIQSVMTVWFTLLS